MGSLVLAHVLFDADLENLNRRWRCRDALSPAAPPEFGLPTNMPCSTSFVRLVISHAYPLKTLKRSRTAHLILARAAGVRPADVSQSLRFKMACSTRLADRHRVNARQTCSEVAACLDGDPDASLSGLEDNLLHKSGSGVEADLD